MRITIARWPKRMHPTCPAPEMVRLCKPAQHREVPFTEPTGGGNDEAGVVERTLADVPARERR